MGGPATHKNEKERPEAETQDRVALQFEVAVAQNRREQGVVEQQSAEQEHEGPAPLLHRPGSQRGECWAESDEPDEEHDAVRGNPSKQWIDRLAVVRLTGK